MHLLNSFALFAIGIFIIVYWDKNTFARYDRIIIVYSVNTHYRILIYCKFFEISVMLLFEQHELSSFLNTLLNSHTINLY